MTWDEQVRLARRVLAAEASGDAAFDYREAAVALAQDILAAEQRIVERDYGRFGPAKRERKPG